VLIRVPATSTATAIVPLYVDDVLLRAEPARERTIEVTVTSLGSSTPLATRSVPLAVRTGNAFASLGLVASILGAVLGNALVVLRLGRWLADVPHGRAHDHRTVRDARVRPRHVTSLAGLIASCGARTLLADRRGHRGRRLPLLDRRYARHARSAAGRGHALDPHRVAPRRDAPRERQRSDVLFVGRSRLPVRDRLYVFGITRSPAWRDDSLFARWLRLSLAFGIASACTSAVGLVLHMTLYRLFFATWYVVLLIALPGFLYVGRGDARRRSVRCVAPADSRDEG
jgi:hypothetical protein